MKGNSGLKKLVLLDKGYDALIKRTTEMGKNGTLTVGIHAGPGSAPKDVPEGQKAPKSPVTVLDVANWMEFGTATIPARSFIRAWADENQEQCRKDIYDALRSVATGRQGMTYKRAFNLLGQKFVGMIQQRMAQGIPPPLKYREGTPLIDTGQLRSSVTYEVKR
jgi:phage gpG-like protein